MADRKTIGEVPKDECRDYGETRRTLEKDLKELRERIQAMMQEHEKLQDIEKLELLEFNLDVDEQKRLQELGEQEVAKVRQEIELENLAKSYQWDVLKKKFYSKSLKENVIKAFHSGCKVEHFPRNERTVEELEELSRVEAVREKEKADTSAPLERDENLTWLDMESPVFKGSVSDQYGGSNSHLYSQFDLHTRDQKRKQIILLQDVIHKLETAFKTEFEALYKQKEQEMSIIRKRNKQIAEIMSCLELEEPLWEPTLSDNDRPESVFTVSDSEIKVEKYLTPEQRQREEEQRKEEEQRRLREKVDDSRDRALLEMMGGILEVKKEDILKMEVPAPEFLTKPELEWTDEERKKYKEYETKVNKLREQQDLCRQSLEESMKKLKASINESTRAFDETLSKLYQRKLKSEMAVYQEELKIANLLHSITIEEEMLQKEKELNNRLEEAKAVEIEISERLTTQREDVEAFQKTYETSVKSDKLLDRRFCKEFCDVPRHILDQLYKLYKRRPRTQIMRAQTESSQSASKGLSQIMKAMEELDAPQYMPEGLDPAVWERFCLVRRTKVESEQKVKMEALLLAEKLALLQKTINEKENAEIEVKKLADELSCLQVEISTLSSKFRVQLLLKQGQVEVENDDYSDSLLLHRSVVEDLNTTIRVIGKMKIASMVEYKELRKKISHHEWLQKKLRMQIKYLKTKARDIQTLYLSKEVLEYLKEPDNDFRISQKVSSMEKTMALEEKIHRKNIKKCKRLLMEMKKEVEDKKKMNADLDLQIKNLQSSNAKRRKIYELSALEEIQEHKAKQRYRKVVHRRKLLDLAKSQERDIATLRTELKRVHMKIFPAFSK